MPCQVLRRVLYAGSGNSSVERALKRELGETEVHTSSSRAQLKGRVEVEQGMAERLEGLGLVPVVELGSVAEAGPLLEALSAAGLPIAEITLRTTAGLAALSALRGSHPDALIGAGTVRSVEDAQRVIEAGAQFVVSPATNPEIVEFCLASGVSIMPGACTPTEVDLGLRAGAKVIKFFPAEAMGGVPFLQALAGPFRDARFVPTGGINASNLADYLRVPGVIACGGSWLVSPALLAERQFDRVEALGREALKIIADVRGG